MEESDIRRSILRTHGVRELDGARPTTARVEDIIPNVGPAGAAIAEAFGWEAARSPAKVPPQLVEQMGEMDIRRSILRTHGIRECDETRASTRQDNFWSSAAEGSVGAAIAEAFGVVIEGMQVKVESKDSFRRRTRRLSASDQLKGAALAALRSAEETSEEMPSGGRETTGHPLAQVDSGDTGSSSVSHTEEYTGLSSSRGVSLQQAPPPHHTLAPRHTHNHNHTQQHHTIKTNTTSKQQQKQQQKQQH